MIQKPFRVFKFGGSSVGAPERIQRVTDLIAQELPQGPIAVTVSAMGDTTDWLLEAVDLATAGDHENATKVAERITELATANAPGCTDLIRKTLEPLSKLLYGVALLKECTAQTMDLILSFGERTSAQVLATLLTSRDIPAVYVDAREWTVTNDRFGQALVDFEASRAKLKALRGTWNDRLPVNTGFLGRTVDGRTTTLGRNGSDYTATLLARALDASEVNIWTDVSGVMTADPGIVRDAYAMAQLSYMEAVELAYFGTKMFHARTMIPLIESGIPMRIRNTMRPSDRGTTINASGAQDLDNPTSVTSLENMALIDIESRRVSLGAKVGERVLNALESADIPVWMATQSAHGQAVAVVIRAEHAALAEEVVRAQLAQEYARGEVDPLRVVTPVTLLSLVCGTMGQRPNVAGHFFATLGGVGVNILAIAQGASLRSISCVIHARDTRMAVRTVHAAFNFAHQEVNLVIMGKGIVGGALLGQIRDQQETLVKDHGLQLKVVAIVDSGRIAFSESGLNLDDWQAALGAGESHGGDFEKLLDDVARMPVPILVDCTAAAGMESLYKRAFARGLHVAAANKKPLTIDYPERQALLSAANSRHRAYAYETTVGASLPVIETLKNLVRTGDRVTLIEGCLSGTLGYLTNQVMDGVALSEAVKTAKDLGYTEPRPQDDLSGMDVARKALILARELGLDLNLSDVQVQPLVPEELMSPSEDVPTFFGRLDDYDQTFGDQIARLKTESKSLRYLCRIDPNAPRDQILTVGPVGVEAGHPATQLKGSEAFVAFSTERYSDYPLIVRGAGAGGQVTAAGVLADALTISQTLRGR